jgi:hypothetical protein
LVNRAALHPHHLQLVRERELRGGAVDHSLVQVQLPVVLHELALPILVHLVPPHRGDRIVVVVVVGGGASIAALARAAGTIDKFEEIEESLLPHESPLQGARGRLYERHRGLRRSDPTARTAASQPSTRLHNPLEPLPAVPGSARESGEGQRREGAGDRGAGLGSRRRSSWRAGRS